MNEINMASRNTVSVFGIDGKYIGQTTLPSVINTPIRPDIIRMVHTNLNKNGRQPYAVSTKAGHQTAAESWGTGRAVARIPRVPGGGTHRSGQGAIGNSCRGGHMYAPTKVWRRWHRKVNNNMKHYAIASALAVSAVPSLVMARGHRIENLPEVPLVLDDSVESVSSTSKALAILKAIGAGADVQRAANSRQIRKGQGKMRNRRRVVRKGPILVYANDNGITRALRNLPGLDVLNVGNLNILKLAPGGHLGRFLIWSQSAFEELNSLFSSCPKKAQIKKSHLIPHPLMKTSDLARLINSDEIQSVVKPIKDFHMKKQNNLRKNPLRNKAAMAKLNPLDLKKMKPRKHITQPNKTAKVFYKQLLKENDYNNEYCTGFLTWLGLNAS